VFEQPWGAIHRFSGGVDDDWDGAATRPLRSHGDDDVGAQRVARGHPEVVVALGVRHGAVLASSHVDVAVPGEFEVLHGECGVLPREAKGDNTLARHGDCVVNGRRQNSCIAPFACVLRRTLIVQRDRHALDARHDLGLHDEFSPTIEEAAIRIRKIQPGHRSQVGIEFRETRRAPVIEKTDGYHRLRVAEDVGPGENWTQLTGEGDCLQLAGEMLSSIPQTHAYWDGRSCCPRDPRGTDHVGLHESLTRSTVARGRLGRHDEA
jgi:hypothetical protein